MPIQKTYVDFFYFDFFMFKKSLKYLKMIQMYEVKFFLIEKSKNDE